MSSAVSTFKAPRVPAEREIAYVDEPTIVTNEISNCGEQEVNTSLPQ